MTEWYHQVPSLNPWVFFFYQSVIQFSKILPSNLTSLWNWSNTINIYSGQWLNMARPFSTTNQKLQCWLRTNACLAVYGLNASFSSTLLAINRISVGEYVIAWPRTINIFHRRIPYVWGKVMQLSYCCDREELKCMIQYLRTALKVYCWLRNYSYLP